MLPSHVSGIHNPWKFENLFPKFSLSRKSNAALPSKALLVSRGTAIDGAADHSFSMDQWTSIHFEVLFHHLLLFGCPSIHFSLLSLIFSYKFCWKKLDHLYYIISHNLDIADYISIVSFDTFFDICINCKLVLWPRALLANIFASSYMWPFKSKFRLFNIKCNSNFSFSVTLAMFDYSVASCG